MVTVYFIWIIRFRIRWRGNDIQSKSKSSQYPAGLDSKIGSCRPPVQARGVNRASTAFRAARFWKILPRTSRAAWFSNVLSRASAAYRVDVHLMMNLCKTKRFFGSYCLRQQQLFFCLSYSFYLRFSDASGRRFVGRILLLVFLQMACCSHCSDALACELLIQNSGQLTGGHLTTKMLSGLQV